MNNNNSERSLSCLAGFLVAFASTVAWLGSGLVILAMQSVAT